MIYLGNYANWIDEKWIDYLLSSEGYPRPSGGKNPDSEEFRQAESVGYDLTKTYWYIYEPEHLPFKIDPPFPVEGIFLYWFIKMLPGQIMPMHQDPHAIEEKNSKRFWMPLQDYKPGHVFIYEDELATHYKKGDLFQYDNSHAIHGACNIGWEPRLIFNFSTYNI